MAENTHTALIISTYLISFAEDYDYGIVNEEVWKKYGLRGTPLSAVSRPNAIRMLTNSYWFHLRLSEINSTNLCNLLVEWCYVCGDTVSVVKELQKKLGVTENGTTDKATIDAINKQEPKTFFSALKALRKAQYTKNASAEKDSARKAVYTKLAERLDAIQFGKVIPNAMYDEKGNAVVTETTFSDPPTVNELVGIQKDRKIYINLYGDVAAVEHENDPSTSSGQVEYEKQDKETGQLNYDILEYYIKSFGAGNIEKNKTDTWLPKLKSQSVANLLAEWGYARKEEVQLIGFLNSHFGIYSRYMALNDESFDAFNCIDPKTLFDKFYAIRKMDTKSETLQGIAFGKLTCKDGRIIRFKEDGTIISDVTNKRSATIPAETNHAPGPNFDILGPFVLSYSGGYVNNGVEPTNRGIRLGTWKVSGTDINRDGMKDEKDFKLMTDEDALEFYKRTYWSRWAQTKGATRINSQSIVNLLADWAISIQCSDEIYDVNKCLGSLGGGTSVTESTFKAINTGDPRAMFKKLHDLRRQYYNNCVKENPKKATYLQGWLKRLDAIQFGELTCKDGKKIKFTEDGLLSGPKLNFELWGNFFISHATGPTKGITDTQWRMYGRDIDKDGDIDAVDFSKITDEAALAILKKTKWDQYHLDQLKSQNIANLLADMLSMDFSGALTYLCRLSGISPTSSNTADTVGKLVEAFNKQPASQFFTELHRTCEKYFKQLIDNNPQKKTLAQEGLKRLDCIQYGELTYRKGKKILFTDDGTVINDNAKQQPTFDIIAPFILSHAGRYSATPTPTNKGITLDEWTREGSDLTGDRKVDENDLKIVNDIHVAPILKNKYWDHILAFSLKSQNIANLLTVTCWNILSSTGNETTANRAVVIRTLIVKLKNLLGTGVSIDKTIAAINKSTNFHVLFDEMQSLLKDFCFSWLESFGKNIPDPQGILDLWLSRLDAIEWNKVTCKNGKTITFTDGGEIQKIVSPEPKADILAPFISSYNKSEVDARTLESKVWIPLQMNRIVSQNIANIIAEWYWRNELIAIKEIQNLLSVEPSGFMDDDTLEAINSRNPEQLFLDISDLQKNDNENKKVDDEWKERFANLQFGKLICKDRRTLVFTDNGTILDDFVAPEPAPEPKPKPKPKPKPDKNTENQEENNSESNNIKPDNGKPEDNTPKHEEGKSEPDKDTKPDTDNGGDTGDEEFFF